MGGGSLDRGVRGSVTPAGADSAAAAAGTDAGASGAIHEIGFGVFAAGRPRHAQASPVGTGEAGAGSPCPVGQQA